MNNSDVNKVLVKLADAFALFTDNPENFKKNTEQARRVVALNEADTKAYNEALTTIAMGNTIKKEIEDAKVMLQRATDEFGITVKAHQEKEDKFSKDKGVFDTDRALLNERLAKTALEKARLEAVQKQQEADQKKIDEGFNKNRADEREIIDGKRRIAQAQQLATGKA